MSNSIATVTAEGYWDYYYVRNDTGTVIEWVKAIPSVRITWVDGQTRVVVHGNICRMGVGALQSMFYLGLAVYHGDRQLALLEGDSRVRACCIDEIKEAAAGIIAWGGNSWVMLETDEGLAELRRTTIDPASGI